MMITSLDAPVVSPFNASRPPTVLLNNQEDRFTAEDVTGAAFNLVRTTLVQCNKSIFSVATHMYTEALAYDILHRKHRHLRPDTWHRTSHTVHRHSHCGYMAVLPIFLSVEQCMVDELPILLPVAHERSDFRLRFHGDADVTPLGSSFWVRQWTYYYVLE